MMYNTEKGKDTNFSLNRRALVLVYYREDLDDTRDHYIFTAMNWEP